MRMTAHVSAFTIRMLPLYFQTDQQRTLFSQG